MSSPQKKYPVLQKGWHLLQTYALTLRSFDLFLQGTLLIVILLQTNVLLLLRRHYGAGFMPAIIEDWVMVGCGLAEFLLGPILAWWGRDKRNFVLSATLALAATSGLLVLAVPFADTRYPYVELCGGSVLSRVEPDIVTEPAIRAVLLITCAVLCTLAKVSVWAHGLTYLDDHQPDNGPYFYGILISIQLSLGLSGQSWLQASSLSSAWWEPHTSISCLTLMFAILFTLFPRQMKEFLVEDDRHFNMDFCQSLSRVFRNKPLMLQTVALGALSSAIFGFVHYDRAFVQARFHIESYRQDPQTSRVVAGVFQSLVIIFFVMIFRIRFSLRRADGVKTSTAARVGGVTAAVLAGLLAAISALSCELGDIAGLQGEYEQPECSQSCGCDSKVYGYSPVCGVETQVTYFSPCNAGCGEVENLNGFLIFSNCTCGMERAVRGACSVSRCRGAFSAYQVLYTVMLAVAGSSFLMQGMAVLRSVRREDKPLAVGASFAAVALLSAVLTHLLYMLISYVTCVYPDGYQCVLHGETVWALSVSSAGLGAASAAASLAASTQRLPPEPSTEL